MQETCQNTERGLGYDKSFGQHAQSASEKPQIEYIRKLRFLIEIELRRIDIQ